MIETTKLNNYPADYIVWEIWRRQNKVCFEKEVFDEPGVIQKSYAQWREHTDGKMKSDTIETEKTSIQQWAKPHSGTLKLNCDVAVTGDGNIGMGFAIRDEDGRMALAGKKEKVEGGSTLLEGITMRYAMQTANQYSLKVEVVESDSRNLIDAINGKQTPSSYSDIVISDICDLAPDIKCKKFEFIQRQHNQVVHYAARGRDFLSIRYPPKHLAQYVEMGARD